jgi:hypothetical protein
MRLIVLLLACSVLLLGVGCDSSKPAPRSGASGYGPESGPPAQFKGVQYPYQTKDSR